MRFVGNVSALFVVAVSHGLDTNSCCSTVSEAVGQRLWTLAWWLAGFFFVFSSRFQKQRFSSFLAAVSHGLGTIFSFILMGSKSDVSAFFRRRFGNGLGAKPAGVLPFRMRAPNTFFLRLAWWLAGFQVLRCAVPCLRQPFVFFVFSRFQKQRFGSFLAAVSHGLGTILLSF